MKKSIHRKASNSDIATVWEAQKKQKRKTGSKSSAHDIRSDSDQVGRKIGSLSHFLISNGSPQAIEGEAKNHDAQFGRLSENKNRQRLPRAWC